MTLYYFTNVSNWKNSISYRKETYYKLFKNIYTLQNYNIVKIRINHNLIT